MTENKRFTLSKDTEWWFVQDNTIQVNEYGYREDLTGEDAYRGLRQDLTEQETVDLLNELAEENQDNKAMIEFLSTENIQIWNELKTRTQIQHQLEEENEQFKNKVYSVIDERINALEDDYNKAVKAGMPSNSVYGEIELLEELKRELEE